MRGRLWSLLVAAIFGGLMLRAVNSSLPNNPASSTQNASGILDILSPFAGLILLMVGIGALITYTWGRSF